MTGVPARTFHQRQRPKPRHENNSVRRTYDLVRFSLPLLEPETVLAEDALIALCSASRNTVRTVLRSLADDGIIVRRPKVGTTVPGSMLLRVDEVMKLPELGDETSFRTRGVLLEALVIPAPTILRDRLQLEEGAYVLVLEGLLLGNDEPAALTVSYVALDRPSDALPLPTDPDPIAMLEERLGVTLGAGGTTVGAMTADEATAERLEIPEGASILWLEDLLVDTDGQPRALSQFRFRGDRIAMRSQFSRRTTPEAAPAAS
jgi:GntR family transcriptional regulator